MTDFPEVAFRCGLEIRLATGDGDPQVLASFDGEGVESGVRFDSLRGNGGHLAFAGANSMIVMDDGIDPRPVLVARARASLLVDDSLLLDPLRALDGPFGHLEARLIFGALLNLQPGIPSGWHLLTFDGHGTWHRLLGSGDMIGFGSTVVSI